MHSQKTLHADSQQIVNFTSFLLLANCQQTCQFQQVAAIEKASLNQTCCNMSFPDFLQLAVDNKIYHISIVKVLLFMCFIGGEPIT